MWRKLRICRHSLSTEKSLASDDRLRVTMLARLESGTSIGRILDEGQLCWHSAWLCQPEVPVAETVTEIVTRPPGTIIRRKSCSAERRLMIDG